MEVKEKIIKKTSAFYLREYHLTCRTENGCACEKVKANLLAQTPQESLMNIVYLRESTSVAFSSSHDIGMNPG